MLCGMLLLSEPMSAAGSGDETTTTYATAIGITVKTNPFVARGSTVAYGRSTVTGVALSQLKEHGFCWSTTPEPTIDDDRTTSYYSNNGYIYRMEELTPSTIYYVRAYALTKEDEVAYGEVVKVITIPAGNITWTYDNGADAAANERINKAVASAVDYWNMLTSINGLKLSVHYGSGTPTADCSYGGWMRVGPNASYQRTGTIMHEMGHAIGVGQHIRWYGPNSPLRAGGNTGNWLGERANKVVQFLDNNPSAVMKGDKTHMWPYGINGAHEDSGQEFLYIGNGLITQALGEDGLPPTGGFSTPAYTFESEDNVKYYLKNENESYGLYSAYLTENKVLRPRWANMTAEEVLKNDSAAWYIHFDPATCLYQIQNVATGRYFTYYEDGKYGIRLTDKTTLGATKRFQLMGSREATSIGTGEGAFVGKSYWIIYPKQNIAPPALSAAKAGATSVNAFDLGDAATDQRWLILTADEVGRLETTMQSLTLLDLKVNGKTIAGFASDVYEYAMDVKPGSDPSTIQIEAEKAPTFKGEIEVVAPESLPGDFVVKVIAEDKTETLYTIHVEENYLYRWSGNGATGSGSEPNKFGWSVTPSVTWGVANGASNRYMDPGNGEYVNYTFDGNAYDQKRILWIRYNNNEEFIYTFDGLKPGHTYNLSYKYGWHNNGVAPKITAGLYQKTDKTLIRRWTGTSATTKRQLKEQVITGLTIPTTASEEDEYYLSFKNAANNDCILVLADFSLVDDGSYTGIEEIFTGTSDYTVHVVEGGVQLSAAKMQEVSIVTSAGIPVRNVKVLPEEPLFVALEPGFYMIGNKKVIVE